MSQRSIDSLLDFSAPRKKEDDPDLFNKFFENSSQGSENDALLRAFKELREKLKVQTREINSLKDELKISNIKLRQSQQALSATLTNSIDLKQQLSQSTTHNQEMKKKTQLLKETLQKQANHQQEVQFAKQALLEIKTYSDLLEQEKAKIMEISLAEKMALEEEIARLKSKIDNDNQFMLELQGNYNKARETIIKQENQLKKLSINYDEEVFNKTWSTENFETQHLLNTIKQLEKEISSLKAKSKKEKEKRVLLEDRIIELEELSGFHNVKAEAFEGEVDMVTKKYLKLEKKYKEAKAKIESLTQEKMEVEQSLNKLIYEHEELAARLKGLNIGQVNAIIQQTQDRLNFINNKKEKIYEEQMPISLDKLKETRPQPQDHRKILSQANRVPNNKQKPSNPCMFGSNLTFGERENDSQQSRAIETRIRRERQEMQRTLKERMLYRKLQASSPSQLSKFRGEYIRSFIDRKY